MTDDIHPAIRAAFAPIRSSLSATLEDGIRAVLARLRADGNRGARE